VLVSSIQHETSECRRGTFYFNVNLNIYPLKILSKYGATKVWGPKVVVQVPFRSVCDVIHQNLSLGPNKLEQQCRIIQHRMHHIHVYMGRKSDEMSPQATSQGETSESRSHGNALIILHSSITRSSCQLCHSSFITQREKTPWKRPKTQHRTPRTPQRHKFPLSNHLQGIKPANLFKSKRSLLISSNCHSHGSCI
jgi:hypothetical protein